MRDEKVPTVELNRIEEQLSLHTYNTKYSTKMGIKFIKNKWKMSFSEIS